MQIHVLPIGQRRLLLHPTEHQLLFISLIFGVVDILEIVYVFDEVGSCLSAAGSHLFFCHGNTRFKQHVVVDY